MKIQPLPFLLPATTALDGMRMPNFPETNMGAGTCAREQPNLEDIKRVEIIRGPASAAT